jgi:hypothetical protein
MIKISTIIFLAFFLISQCKNQGTDVRQRLIKETIKAISSKDTLKLFSLVDTAHCFNIYSKEAFFNKVDFVYNRMNLCGKKIDFKTVRIQKDESFHTTYFIPFCNRNLQGQSDSFNLVLTFADYRKDDVIDFMDVHIFKEIEYPETIPFGKH